MIIPTNLVEAFAPHSTEFLDSLNRRPRLVGRGVHLTGNYLPKFLRELRAAFETRYFLDTPSLKYPGVTIEGDPYFQKCVDLFIFEEVLRPGETDNNWDIKAWGEIKKAAAGPVPFTSLYGVTNPSIQLINVYEIPEKVGVCFSFLMTVSSSNFVKTGGLCINVWVIRQKTTPWKPFVLPYEGGGILFKFIKHIFAYYGLQFNNDGSVGITVTHEGQTVTEKIPYLCISSLLENYFVSTNGMSFSETTVSKDTIYRAVIQTGLASPDMFGLVNPSDNSSPYKYTVAKEFRNQDSHLNEFISFVTASSQEAGLRFYPKDISIAREMFMNNIESCSSLTDFRNFLKSIAAELEETKSKKIMEQEWEGKLPSITVSNYEKIFFRPKFAHSLEVVK